MEKRTKRLFLLELSPFFSVYATNRHSYLNSCHYETIPAVYERGYVFVQDVQCASRYTDRRFDGHRIWEPGTTKRRR